MKMSSLKKLALAILLSCAAFSATTFADNGGHRAHAVTLWWVIFNNPSACITNPDGDEKCSALDVFGAPYLESVEQGTPDPSLIMPNTQAGLAVIYATGGVTDSRNGKIRLAASIYRSEGSLDLTGEQLVDPMGLGMGFTNRDAEVHLVVRDHGRVRREGRIAQISNFLEPYCSDPQLLFEGGRNVCQDIQFSIFAPEKAGQDAVIRASNGRMQGEAAAYLFRQGDMLQAIVETRVADRRRPQH